MERLTARNDGNPYYPRCFELPCEGLLCEREECDLGYKIIDRLAAYEDTGLDPKEIRVEIERLKEENKRLHEENFWLTGHGEKQEK